MPKYLHNHKQSINELCILVFFLLIPFSSFSQLQYSLPINIIDYRIYLNGMINGKTCNFLFDTGDYGVILDKQFKEKNNIVIPKLSERKEFEISLNGFTKKTLFIRVQDCNSIGGNSDQGVIGVDFFKDYIVEIDYKNKLLNLYSTDYIVDSTYSVLSPKQLKGLFIHGSFIFDLIVNIDDSTSFTGNFLFDTGSGRNITILNHVNLNFNSDSALRKGINSNHHGLNLSKYFVAKSVSFNNESYNNLVIDYILDESNEVSKKIDGIIGGQFLQNFKIIIDYKKSLIYLKKQENPLGFTKKLITDGIIYRDRRTDLGGLLVSGIIIHPSLKTDIKLNDLIIKINDKDVNEIDYVKMRELQSIKNNSIKYTIKRKRKIITINTNVKKIL